MPYLLHDHNTPYNQWHQQRVLTQPSTTVELFAIASSLHQYDRSRKSAQVRSRLLFPSAIALAGLA